MTDTLRIFHGDLKSDLRGTVSFVNAFNFSKVKRFYTVQNRSTKIIRAFHGHYIEAKYVYVVSGSIKFCAVKLTDKLNPSKKALVKKFLLSAKKPTLLYVPPKYANGFRALEAGTKVVFFSTATLEQSKKDDFRFAFDYWGREVWE